MRYTPEDGRWEVVETPGTRAARGAFTKEDFEASRQSLKKYLCNYFSNGQCNTAQGDSINPLGATPSGGKILKVRWALPGGGKSGGLRLTVVVYCKERRVVIAEAFVRNTDPPSQSFLDAVADFP